VEQHLPAGVSGRVADGNAPVPAPQRRGRIGRTLAPYLLVFPGGVWLLLFFLIPLVYTASASLMTGSPSAGYKLTWHFANYADVFSLYKVEFLHSILYSGIATIITLGVAYPVAYWIAFYGGRRKNFFLLLLLLPFFVSFVIRTLAWQFILSDDGIVLGTLKHWHLLPENFHVLATAFAVIAGIAYNFLPFMALPLYVALERIDRRVIEAAGDLYASKTQTFLKVIFPLSIPGVFAGVLLTFVPGAGDYVNAQILGGPANTMLGNVIQTLYLTNFQYNQAAALSFLLMAALLLGIFAYARILGTRSIQEYV
jgi:spermidine/putrescine transport system permease protein